MGVRWLKIKNPGYSQADVNCSTDQFGEFELECCPTPGWRRAEGGSIAWPPPALGLAAVYPEHADCEARANSNYSDTRAFRIAGILERANKITNSDLLHSVRQLSVG